MVYDHSVIHQYDYCIILFNNTTPFITIQYNLECCRFLYIPLINVYIFSSYICIYIYIKHTWCIFNKGHKKIIIKV